MAVSIISLGVTGTIAEKLAGALAVVHTTAIMHRFPDGEICVRVDPRDINKQMVVVATLYHPDELMLPLVFLAETLHDYGVEHIVLVAPYLAYMRQDRRFKEGEGISARYFARLISDYFDTLVTVDPHLHRIKSLDEIYSIPARVVHAAPQVADWIRNNIDKPLLIGPDSESEQWVRDLAQRAQAPFVVLEKIRHGDRAVEVSVPETGRWQQHTPVLFDDIISTGRTMIETIGHLHQAGLPAPVCIGVHGIFCGNAYRELLTAGAERVVTSNTIAHNSNAINIIPPVVTAIHEFLKKFQDYDE